MEEAIFIVRWKKRNKYVARDQMDNHYVDDLQPWSYEKIPNNGDIGTQLAKLTFISKFYCDNI
jgi:hypothetical protein